MRDEETESWWQQVTGKCIFGALKGQSLEMVPSDELTFGTWKKEAPTGQVLAPVAAYAGKYESNWESEVEKLPTVVEFPDSALQSRDVVLGVQIGQVSRAYPFTAVKSQWPIQDRVGGMPILLVLASDGKSVRGFIRQVDGVEMEFFRKTEGTGWGLVDSAGHEWTFEGCSVDSPKNCLERILFLKDYWFDWRNYHPDTTIYRH